MPHAILEIFLWLFGLCVGSFLNVVVYRLPAGLSVAQPRRSFCPRCKAGITWYDNLPVLSWFVLRGRCRHCGGRISVQYPLVEALTGLTFVLVYHLLFVTQARAGIATPTLPTDLPLLLSWLFLAAGLIACAAMDITSYTVDVRVTNIVVGLGIILHALWPRVSSFSPHAASPTGAAMLTGFVAALLMMWWSLRRQDESEEAQEQTGEVSSPAASTDEKPSAGHLAARLAVFALVVVAAFLIAIAGAGGGAGWMSFVVPAALVLMFMTIVLAGGQERQVDEEIVAAIEEERPQARKVALKELAWLAPMILVAAATMLVIGKSAAAEAFWLWATQWSPVCGVVFAIHGAMVAAAAGWTLRIVFTLALGREAFGVGDIYILAAAGAAAGWDIALIGLLLSTGIALAGVILGLVLKCTAIIPFGPWLGLGFLAALWLNHTGERIARQYHANVTELWHQRPDLLLTAGGIVLVGTAAALVLSRLLRRVFLPRA